MAPRPMFPLGSVLLPGMVLPLHVFEERYRRLVGDCLAGDRSFGVTLIERGSEVGGGDIRAMAGTMAEIVQAEELPDGRWQVVAVGRSRLRVREWLPDGAYPQAEVEDWPDEPAPDRAALRGAYDARVEALERILALIAELGVEVPDLALSHDPAEGSFQIAVLAPLGALDRQRILVAPGAADRLALLEEMLEDQELMLRARLEG
ncbi:MAG: LON peptidase substrate-binding domain-containing protein [Acidimicrobiales bacterium]